MNEQMLKKVNSIIASKSEELSNPRWLSKDVYGSGQVHKAIFECFWNVVDKHFPESTNYMDEDSNFSYEAVAKIQSLMLENTKGIIDAIAELENLDMTCAYIRAYAKMQAEDCIENKLFDGGWGSQESTSYLTCCIYGTILKTSLLNDDYIEEYIDAIVGQKKITKHDWNFLSLLEQEQERFYVPILDLILSYQDMR